MSEDKAPQAVPVHAEVETDSDGNPKIKVNFAPGAFDSFDGTQEELDELFEAISLDDIDLARDAIGDILVTLAIQAKMWNLKMDDCIEAAWDEIKDRRGRMQNGLFVKESIDDATPDEWDAVAKRLPPGDRA